MDSNLGYYFVHFFKKETFSIRTICWICIAFSHLRLQIQHTKYVIFSSHRFYKRKTIRYFSSGEQRAKGGGRPNPGDEDHAGDRLSPQRGHHPGRLHGARWKRLGNICPTRVSEVISDTSWPNTDLDQMFHDSVKDSWWKNVGFMQN